MTRRQDKEKNDPQELEEEHAMNEEVDIDPYATRTRRIQR